MHDGIEHEANPTPDHTQLIFVTICKRTLAGREQLEAVRQHHAYFAALPESGAKLNAHKNSIAVRCVDVRATGDDSDKVSSSHGPLARHNLVRI